MVANFVNQGATINAIARVVHASVVVVDMGVEQGHRAAPAHLGKKPLLDLDLRLGEGTGGTLAMALVEAALRILTEVATFEEASVSKAQE